MERRTNGAAVRAIREALGMRQDGMAARAGIDKTHLSKIETGTKQPSPRIARAIAAELGVPLDAITYPWPGGEEFDEAEPAKVAS